MVGRFEVGAYPDLPGRAGPGSAWRHEVDDDHVCGGGRAGIAIAAHSFTGAIAPGEVPSPSGSIHLAVLGDPQWGE